MIRITLRTSRLAASIVKPAAIQLNSYRAASSTSCLRASNYFCSNSQFDSPKLKKPFRAHTTVLQQSKRHCSHRRTMCKANVDLTGGSMDVGKGREVLPTNVKPVHYDLTLEPNFEKFSYEGKVIIEYVLLMALWTWKIVCDTSYSQLSSLTG